MFKNLTNKAKQVAANTVANTKELAAVCKTPEGKKLIKNYAAGFGLGVVTMILIGQ